MSHSSDWEQWLDGELRQIKAAGQWRTLRPLRGRGPEFTDAEGAAVVSFASNDYLGLAAHPAVVRACAEAADRFGCGTGSSRLIVGDRAVHHDLEDDLSRWKDTDAALVLPSGYQANLAALTTFGSGAGCRIVSDELNHASIIDGARLARSEVKIYRHGDADEAASLVRSASGPVVVVTDSVFSMDGDEAPVAELSAVCAREGALLVLDDAHAVFPMPEVDPESLCMRVGTLSKVLGSQGGYIAGPQRFVDLLVNRARSFIFSTGLTPPAAASAQAALQILRSPEGIALLSRLRSRIDAVAPHHASPIIPVVLGSEADAVSASATLLAAGLLVPAIRPPTVPRGSSRLRISLSAAHSEADVGRLVSALTALGCPVGSRRDGDQNEPVRL